MSESQMYTAEVILDSISSAGYRITTIKAIYPHAVHKDMLRHRCMNRNVESFRAQPPEKLIEALRNGHAFKPDVFAKRTKGMGQSSAAIKEAKKASLIWDDHLHDVLEIAEEFLSMGIAKQQVNFLLQDLCPLTEVITATDWTNFYALRTEVKEDGTPMARPEVYKTAVAIRDAIEGSIPQEHELHLPMLTSTEYGHAYDYGETDFWIGVSAGRCAKISYGDYHWWEEEPNKGYHRSRMLLENGHMSPFEQQARSFSEERWEHVGRLRESIYMRGDPSFPASERNEMARQLLYSGNLRGWVPARKMLPYEWDYGELREHDRSS